MLAYATVSPPRRIAPAPPIFGSSPAASDHRYEHGTSELVGGRMSVLARWATWLDAAQRSFDIQRVDGVPATRPSRFRADPFLRSFAKRRGQRRRSRSGETRSRPWRRESRPRRGSQKTQLMKSVAKRRGRCAAGTEGSSSKHRLQCWHNGRFLHRGGATIESAQSFGAPKT